MTIKVIALIYDSLNTVWKRVIEHHARRQLQYPVGMGRDRRIDLSRIADTVATADIVALQEVERNWRDQEFPDQTLRLAELLPEYNWVYGAAVNLHGGTGIRRQIGNMILSRLPIESTRTLPLPSRPVKGHVNDQQAMIEIGRAHV